MTMNLSPDEIRKQILEIDNSISKLEQKKRELRYELRSVKGVLKEVKLPESSLSEIRRKLLE